MTALRRQLKAVIVRELDQELLVLDTESNQVHHLNETASFIWRKCDDTTLAEELALLLANAFNVEQGTALNDVVETLQKLRALNLLVEV